MGQELGTSPEQQPESSLEALHTRLGFSETPEMRDLRDQIAQRFQRGEVPADLSKDGAQPNELNGLLANYHTSGIEQIEKLIPAEHGEGEAWDQQSEKYVQAQIGLNVALLRIYHDAGRSADINEMAEGDEGILSGIWQEGHPDISKELEHLLKELGHL